MKLQCGGVYVYKSRSSSRGDCTCKFEYNSTLLLPRHLVTRLATRIIRDDKVSGVGDSEYEMGRKCVTNLEYHNSASLCTCTIVIIIIICASSWPPPRWKELDVD